VRLRDMQDKLNRRPFLNECKQFDREEEEHILPEATVEPNTRRTYVEPAARVYTPRFSYSDYSVEDFDVDQKRNSFS
jgi:hypothetical protein